MRDFSGYQEQCVLDKNKEWYTARLADGRTLYVYNTLEECENVVVSTRILGEMGIPVQDVELGIYKGRYVVASKDYMKNSERFESLRSLLYPTGETSDDLSDITKKFGELKYDNKDDMISWFWSVLVVNGALCYAGRSLDNMGVLYDVNTKTIRACPIIGGHRGLDFSKDESRMKRVLHNSHNLVTHAVVCDPLKFEYDGHCARFWYLVKHCDLEVFRKIVNDYEKSIDLTKVYSIIDGVEGLSPIKKKIAKECFFITYNMLRNPREYY